jgi:hypothetical protein
MMYLQTDIHKFQVVSMLKTCVSSSTIFTDVFLAKGTADGSAPQPALINRSLLTIHRPQGKKPTTIARQSASNFSTIGRT